MKKHISIICLFILFASTNAFCGISNRTEDFLRKTLETYDLLDFPAVPRCVALNSEHYVAVLFQDNSSEKITLIEPSGEQSTFCFNIMGSSLIELAEDRIILYLLRSDLRRIYDFEGNLISSDEFSLSHKDYTRLREQTELRCGEAMLSVKRSWKEYELFLDNRKLIHCSISALFVSKMSYFPLVFVPSVFIFLSIKYAKENSKVREKEND